MKRISSKTKFEILKALIITALILVAVIPIGLDFGIITLSRYFHISIPIFTEIKNLARMIFESRIGMWTVIAAFTVILTYFINFIERLIGKERKRDNLRIGLKEEMFANFNQMFLYDKDLKLEKEQFRLLCRNLSMVKDFSLYSDVLALYKNWEKFNSTVLTTYGFALFQCSKIALEFISEYTDLEESEKGHIASDLKNLEEILHRSIITEAEFEYIREGIYKKYREKLETYLIKLTDKLI